MKPVFLFTVYYMPDCFCDSVCIISVVDARTDFELAPDC
jgi:hypothetical protein